MIDIRDIQGGLKLSFIPNSGSLIKRELMGEHYLLLRYNLSSPIDFEVGDYIVYNNGQGQSRYELTEKTFPKYNTSTGGYEYDLKFEAYYLKWGNKMLFYDRQFAGGEATWSLTRTPDAHLSIVCSNLERLGYNYNSQAITFSIDESVDMSAKLIQYDGTNIIDALTLIAETWECEWWVEDNIIHLGRCEYNSPVDLELGGNVQNMTRSESQDTYATRIYAFGSERNLPTNYRESSGVVEAVVTKRLMLPSGTNYVDAENNLETEQAVEAVVVFDDVYPRRTGTMSSITTKEYTDTIENADGSTTEEKWNAYRFKDTGLTFSKDYVLPGEELRLVFTSGKLNGMDFALAFNPDAKTPEEQLFEIIRSEDYGIALPNATLKPENGDAYILYGFNTALVGSQYVPAAEQELLERAQAYMEKSKIDPSVFSVEMNSVAVIQDDLDFEIGDRVNLIHRGFFKSGRESRIRGYEKHLDGSKVTYSVGNKAAYSRLKEVEGEVKEIVYQGNVYSSGGGSSVYVIGKRDLTTPSDRNVFSSLRTLLEITTRSLSRLNDDTAAGIITFIKGIILGYNGDKITVDDVTGKAIAVLGTITSDLIKSEAFTEGMLGSGFVVRRNAVTGKSYIEVDELFVRLKAVFRELVIEKVSHVGGEIILSPARMKCIKVDVLSNAYRCYFLSNDGEREIYNEFVVGDQARCQTFNIKPGVYQNVSNRYYWRLVTGIGDDYIDLSKTDADANSDVPESGDDICQLGNRTDRDRQNAIVMSSHGSDAPSYKQYAGISGYVLSGKEVTKITPSGNSFVGDFKLNTGTSLSTEISNVKTTADEAYAQAVENQEFINDLSIDLEEVKRQADGAIETWFYDPAPTLSNVPASLWTTDAIKNVHLGDLYYSKEGKAYRFTLSNGVYTWIVITDTDITKALANAQKAQDTADGKRRVFVVQPTTDSEYDIGDLWVNATAGTYTNELLRCKTAKASGVVFNISHWDKASKYTDDTKAEEAAQAALAAKGVADAAVQAAGDAQADADIANNLLSDIANDNKFTPNEKQETKKEWDIIVSEYTKNVAQATAFGITSTTYTTAYNALSTYITPLLANLSSTSDIVGSTFKSTFKSYYDARTDLLNAIATKAKTLADAAQTAANTANTAAGAAATAAATAQADATTAKNAATAAQGSATTANNLLAEIANDNKLTATEKQDTKLEWDIIQSEYTKNVAQATTFGVSSTTYATAYNSLSSYITPLLASLTTTSDITGTTFRSTFKSYYDARTDLLNAIATKAKTLADAAQTAANTANNTITTVKTDLTAEINAIPGKISLAVSETKTYTDTAVAGVQVGGDNLLRNGDFGKYGTNESIGWDKSLNGNYTIGSWGTGYNSGVTSPTVGYHAHFNTLLFGYPVLELINKNSLFGLAGRWMGIVSTVYQGGKLIAGGTYTFSADVMVDTIGRYIHGGLYSKKKGATGFAFSSGTYNLKPAVDSKWERISYTFTVDADIDLSNAPTFYIYGHSGTEGTAWVRNVSLQQGTKGFYSACAGDINDDVSSAQTAAAAAQTAANTANSLLTDIASDNKLTANEKQETKKEWDAIVSEYSKNITQAGKFSVSTTAYTTAYNALSTYITPLLASLTTTSDITGTTFRSTFKAYYDARTDLLNAISVKAKDLADAAQSTATNAQTRVSTAETSITQLSNSIALKASASDVTSLASRVTSAEALITSNAINLTVKSQTETIAGTAAANAAKRTEVTVDATGLDSSKYYPITIGMNSTVPYTITVERALNSSYGLPSWGTHTGGFSVLCKWTSNGSGWGVIAVKRTVHSFAYAWTNGAIPAGSIGQMTNSSSEYIYVRGGSKYNVLVEGTSSASVTLRTGSYTISSQTIDILTSVVTPVADIEQRPTTETITSQFTMDTSGISMLGKKIAFTGMVTFSSLSSDAQTKVNTAQSTADTAKSTADTAKTNAATAQSTADTAKTNAATAQTAANTAQSAASAAQTTANNAASAAGTANSGLSTLKDALKSLAYLDAVGLAKLDSTIIDGGYIKTSLIDANAIITGTLLAEKIAATDITTGRLTVTVGAKIGPFTVESGQLRAVSGYNEMILTSNLMRFSESSKSTYMYVGGDVFPATMGGSMAGPCRIEVSRSVAAYASGNVGAYISVTGSTSYDDNGYQYTGNHAFYVENGDYAGFRMRTRRVSSSQTLSHMDNVILSIATSAITLTLPSSPKEGQIYFIRKCASGNVTIAVGGSSHKIMRQFGSTVTSATLINGDLGFLIWDKVNLTWLYNYASYY